MAVTREKKDTERQALEDAFKQAESAILVDYRGLNVPQVTDLRRQVRGAKASYRVVKNRIARRALKGTAFESLEAHFVGTTAVAYTNDDVVALAKVLAAFTKSAPDFKVKVAVVEGKSLEAADVGELATLPGRPELLAKLLFVMQAPMQQFVSVLNAAPRDLVNLLSAAERKRNETST